MLGEDPLPVAADELPDALEKGFAPDRPAVETFRLELALDQGVDGERRVVDAGKPQGGPSLHPPPTDQDVLDRVHHCVAEMQLTREVRRRHDDRVRIAVRPGRKISRLLPHLVKAALHGGRVVSLRHFFPGARFDSHRRFTFLFTLFPRAPWETFVCPSLCNIKKMYAPRYKPNAPSFNAHLHAL